MQEFEGDFQFQASWKDTCVHMQQRARCSPTQAHDENGGANGTGTPAPPRKRQRGADAKPASGPPCRAERRVRVDTVFSDVLYQPHLCATAAIDSTWCSPDTLPRCTHLSAAEFRAEFEAAGEPVVVTTGAAFACAERKWSMEHIESVLSHVVAGEQPPATAAVSVVLPRAIVLVAPLAPENSGYASVAFAAGCVPRIRSLSCT